MAGDGKITPRLATTRRNRGDIAEPPARRHQRPGWHRSSTTALEWVTAGSLLTTVLLASGLVATRHNGNGYDGSLALAALLVVLLLPALVLICRDSQRTDRRSAGPVDPVTGLPTLEAWWPAAERELARIRRDGAHSALLMIGLDQRGAASDKQQRASGDELSAAVAQIVRTQSTRTGLTVRLRSATFVLLLADTTIDRASTVAHRICAAARELSSGPDRADCPTRCSVSIGVAELPCDGTSLDELILAADVLLFTAQDLGGDRIQFSRHRNGTPPGLSRPPGAS